MSVNFGKPTIYTQVILLIIESLTLHLLYVALSHKSTKVISTITSLAEGILHV